MFSTVECQCSLSGRDERVHDYVRRGLRIQAMTVTIVA